VEREQKEIRIHRVIDGALVKNVQHAYSWCHDSASIYITEKGIISALFISEYDNKGRLSRVLMYGPMGLHEEYYHKSLIQGLIDGSAHNRYLLKRSVGKSVKGWKLIGNDKIVRGKDTLKIETTLNNLGINVFANIIKGSGEVGSLIRIFEYDFLDVVGVVGTENVIWHQNNQND